METLLKISNPVDSCHIKAASTEGDDFTFAGYPSVYNGEDFYGDTILPGAYKNVLKEMEKGAARPFGFFNHRHWEVPVLDWLELSEDKVGLAAKGLIDKVHKDGPTLFSAVKRKAITGLSVGIRLHKDDYDWKDEDDHSQGRNIKNITELVEISVVTMPADDSARISNVKSIIDTLDSLKDCEDFLREVGGFSHSAARDFVSVFKRFSNLREVDFKGEREANTDALVQMFKQHQPDLTLLDR